MIRELVSEKETKIKEGMKMMSLGSGALVLSWLLNFCSVFWIISVFITVNANQLFVFSDAKVRKVEKGGMLKTTS